ncbi:MAG: MOSC domain-containing protein [Pseudomonadota bacterium]
MTKTILEKIYRFPFKGFPGQELSEAALKVETGIPHDRQFAITKGTVDTGEWMPARSFYINSTTDGMSKFKLAFDGDTVQLQNVDGMKLELKLGEAESLEAANGQLGEFLGPVGILEGLPEPQIIDRKGDQPNWDYADTPISIINAESVKAVSDVLGEELDPLRFRGNLIISGLPAWEEFSWMGKRIQIGSSELEVHRPIDRCPTPGVNPVTGERDVEVTPGIQEHFGHIHCGMYAKIVKSGDISAGDEFMVVGDAEMPWHEARTDYASAYALWPRAAKVVSSDAGSTQTIITLESATPWPLPAAVPNQRLRIHIGPDQWTAQYLSGVTSYQYQITVEDSKTGDPVTALLRNGLAAGETILVSGPFGKVK